MSLANDGMGIFLIEQKDARQLRGQTIAYHEAMRDSETREAK
jgi:hypothetical protein